MLSQSPRRSPAPAAAAAARAPGRGVAAARRPWACSALRAAQVCLLGIAEGGKKGSGGARREGEGGEGTGTGASRPLSSLRRPGCSRAAATLPRRRSLVPDLPNRILRVWVGSSEAPAIATSSYTHRHVIHHTRATPATTDMSSSSGGPRRRHASHHRHFIHTGAVQHHLLCHPHPRAPSSVSASVTASLPHAMPVPPPPTMLAHEASLNVNARET